MKKPKLFCHLAAAVVAVWTGAAAAEDEAAALTLADGTTVTVAEVRDNVAALRSQAQTEVAKSPEKLESIVRLIAAQKLLLREARDTKWDRRPEVAAAIDLATKNTVLQSYLTAQSEPPKDYPSEKDIDAFYAANQTALTQPRRVRLEQIFIAVPTGASVADRKRAQSEAAAVSKRLAVPGVDFDALAKVRASGGLPAQKQGELGTFTDAELSIAIREAVQKLGKGGITSAVRMEDGWRILKVSEVTPAAVPPLNAVREKLSEQMRAQRRVENEKALLDGEMKKVPPIDQNRLLALMAVTANK